MPKSDSYKTLLDKINKMNLSGGMDFWKPDQGRSTIRILPAVKGMDFFFKEVGVHYLGDQGRFYCPNLCTEGEKDCPICDVRQAMYEGGESELASKYNYSRAFWMNVIVRGEEGAGPKVYTPGVQIFSTVASYIADPEYGDITDPWEGFDVKIDRKGTGLQTEYQVRCSRKPSELGDDEDIANWLENAIDIEQYILSKLMPYEELMSESGVSIYFEGGDEQKPEPDTEPKREESELSASERIQRMLDRQK